MSDLTINIEKIKKATISKKIVWKKNSDKAFIWTTSDSQKNPVNLVLQEVSSSFGGKIFLRLWDVTRQASLLELTSESKDVAVSSAVTDLYKFVQNNYKIGDLDILSDILKDL